MADDSMERRRAIDYITTGEFSRYTGLLEEIRIDLKGGLERHRVELAEMGKRIADRQDLSNGRLHKAEVDILTTIADLKVLETKAANYRDTRAQERTAEHAVVVAIKTELDTLMEEGCRVRKEHAAEVQILDQVSGGMGRKLRPGPAVGFGLGGLSLGVVAPHLGDFLHWLLSFLPVVKP